MADLLSADDHQAALDDLAQQLSAALSGTELVEFVQTMNVYTTWLTRLQTTANRVEAIQASHRT